MPPAAYHSAAQTQINLPQSQLPPPKAPAHQLDPKQLMMDQNKQKFLPKNFSFAILQSENAMKVNALGAQQQQANAAAFAAQLSGHHQLMQEANINAKLGQLNSPM